MRALTLIVSLAALVAGVFYVRPAPDLDSPPAVPPSLDTAGATRLLNRQAGFFVPNLGQWEHAAKMVHRSGPMTIFLEDRGWILDLAERSTRPVIDSTCPELTNDRDTDQESRGVALRMTFEGDGHVPEIVGEKKLPGHHNYFLGSDESRWRTDVPLYSSVRYENLYAGIDLRLREVNGVPEYDLLLQPGSDLSRVTVHVEGGQCMSIASDGSLVIETALGPLTQAVPKTWQVDADGTKRVVVCNFTLFDGDRFGFVAPGWDGDTNLTIDPGLTWSTLFGGNHVDSGRAFSVDASGVVTVAGHTSSTNFPATSGAYDTTHNGGPRDVFVSRLDPQKTGTAQLVYSTFLGGSGEDIARALSIDASGVVTVAGSTLSAKFPVTSGAYDTTINGGEDAFVSRLDPTKTGTAQLVYSSFLGGSNHDYALALSADASGVVAMVGFTLSTNFPTSGGAYDTTYDAKWDAFVSLLDPRKTGTAQLVYSTYLGGGNDDAANAVSVDASGVVTVAGHATSTNFPTTNGAYDTSHGGGWDAFVSRLDPKKTGAAQLVYSTFLGGMRSEFAHALSTDASGVVTVTGDTGSAAFPTTSGAYDSIFNGGEDAFVIRLDSQKTGNAQLIYSTFLGGSGIEHTEALSVDASGVVTVAGVTGSANFPTTSDAYKSTYNGGLADVFVSRLDPQKTGAAQLVHSTFLGGSGVDIGWGISVDAVGGVTVTGETQSTNFPTTSGAYDSTHNGNFDVFASRLSMGIAFHADRFELSLKQAGTQNLWLDAGTTNANRSYAIFGSLTGTSPGITLLGIHIPLNVDPYTDLTIGAAVPPIFVRFRGTLDGKGEATASFNVPSRLPPLSGITLHHAYVVFDMSGKFYMASNAVPLRLK